MKAFPDKKTNVARGFCDVHTPSQHAEELLLRIGGQKALLNKKRAVINLEREALIADCPRRNSSKIKVCNKNLKDNGRAIHKINTTARDGVDKSQLVVQRLHEVVAPDVFEEACRLAALDLEFVMNNKPAIDIN